MAHVITIEVEEGDTHDCSVCPFNIDVESNLGYTGISFCGKPEQLPDCDDVNYAEMQVTNN